MLLFQQMAVMFVIMVIGWAGGKKGVFDDPFMDKISWLVVNIANPALILSASVCSDGTIRGESLVTISVIAVLIYAGSIALGYIFAAAARCKADERGVYRTMIVFSNMGFMGFPILSAMYGSEILLYGTPFILIFNLLIYTWGITTLGSGGGSEGFSFRRLLNPGVIASVISVIIYLLEPEMPLFVQNTVETLSNLTAPLSMMVIGYSFCAIRFRELFTDVRLIVYSLVKLIVMPLAGMSLIMRFIDDEFMLAMCLIVLGTPAGSMVAILSKHCGCSHETASKGVALSTLLSVATLPLMFAVLGM